MAIIDPEGLFEGERLAACSDIAQLYWQRLFLAANSCARMELSYQSIISKVFKTFTRPPTQSELWEVFEEFDKNFLAVLYQADGIWWCQFITSDKYLPKYKKSRDEATPAPPLELLDFHRHGYLEWRKRNSFSNQSFRKPSEDFQRRGEEKSGVGVGEVVEKRGEVKPPPAPIQPPQPDQQYDFSSEEIPEGMTSWQYAVGLLEHCNIPRAMATERSAAAAIEAYAKEHKMALHRATAALMGLVRAAISRGESVTKFWFEDAKYKGSANGVTANRSQQRTNSNIAAVQEFAARRGIDLDGIGEARGSAPGRSEQRGNGNLLRPPDPV